MNRMHRLIAHSSWPISAILILAAVTRLTGVWYGYPYSFYPDEAHFVKRALSFGSMDFNPHWFHKPAFYMYLLFFEYGVLYIVGKLAGMWETVSDFAVAYIINPGPFYIIGRITTVLFSLGSIWITYFLGVKHFNKGTGITAALLLALCYGHVVTAQDIKADTPAMFFAILSMYFLLNYLKNYTISSLLLAAAMAGVGTATKKYPIVILVPIVVSVILVHKDNAKKIFSALLSVAGYTGMILGTFYFSYFVCSPYNFIDPQGRRSTFGFIFQMVDKFRTFISGTQNQHPGNFLDQKTGLIGGFKNYFLVLLAQEGMGLVIGGLGILGVFFMFLQLNRKTLVFLFFPIIFILASVYAFPGYAQTRHQIPLYPFLVICGGFLIMSMVDKVKAGKKLMVVLLLGLLVFPLYGIIQYDVNALKQDTRNLAKKWIEKNIPSGTRLLIDENGPKLLMSERRIKKIMERAAQEDPEGQFTAHYDIYLNYQLLAAKDAATYDLEFIRLPWWREKEVKPGRYYAMSDYDRDMGNPLKPVGVASYDYYKNNGYEYIVIISDMYKKFIKKDSGVAANFPSFREFYSTLFDRGYLVKEFDASSLGCRGPTIKIFKVV